jgi:hypothetical protein
MKTKRTLKVALDAVRPGTASKNVFRFILSIIPVCAPLPHIPCHVVQAIPVGQINSYKNGTVKIVRTDRVRAFTAFPIVPSGILPPIRTTRCLLPLRFRRQTHACPGAIRFRILPTYIHNGVILIPSPRGSRRHLLPVCLTELPILCYRHHIFVDPISIQIYGSLRLFIVIIITPHDEFPDRDPHHLRAINRTDFLLAFRSGIGRRCIYSRHESRVRIGIIGGNPYPAQKRQNQNQTHRIRTGTWRSKGNRRWPGRSLNRNGRCGRWCCCRWYGCRNHGRRHHRCRCH